MGKWVHRLSYIDKVDFVGVCENCGLVNLYYSPATGKYRCPIAKAEHRGERASRLHGLKPSSAEALKKKNGVCEICGSTKLEDLRIDHDHADGSLRGILCNNCNIGLGHFKDNINLLKNAINYLSS